MIATNACMRKTFLVAAALVAVGALLDRSSAQSAGEKPKLRWRRIAGHSKCLF